MFLIEFEENKFIDGERVDWVSMVKGSISFTLSGDTETLYSAKGEYAKTFINNISAIDCNNGGYLESKFLALANKDNNNE